MLAIFHFSSTFTIVIIIIIVTSMIFYIIMIIIIIVTNTFTIAIYIENSTASNVMIFISITVILSS